MHSLEKLKENSVWYDANLDSLLPQYRGRYIAISGAITEHAAWWGEAQGGARRPAEPHNLLLYACCFPRPTSGPPGGRPLPDRRGRARSPSAPRQRRESVPPT